MEPVDQHQADYCATCGSGRYTEAYARCIKREIYNAAGECVVCRRRCGESWGDWKIRCHFAEKKKARRRAWGLP